jgi:outer membrane protein insertion porin family
MEDVVLIKKMILFFILVTASSLVLAEDIVVPKGAVLKKITWADPVAEKRFNFYFSKIMNQPFDALTFKLQSDLIAKEMFNAGFFSSNLKPQVTTNNNKVEVLMVGELKERINFHFSGNSILSHQEIKNKLIEKIKNDFGKIDRDSISNYIIKLYEDVGYFESKVSFYQGSGKDLDNKEVINYFFKINEGSKVVVKNVVYRGNMVISTRELGEVFRSTASPLASAGYYDPIYFETYSEALKKEYLSKGFVFVEISKPRLITDDSDKSLTIEYVIAEKQQVKLKSLILNKIPEQLQEGVRKVLTNQQGEPLNVVELENDLRKMIVYFQSEGYYFASITNLNADTLLNYDKTYSFAELKPEISLDKQICFNEAIINGNSKTQSVVINREIEFQKGELITPAKIETLRQKLSGLNLFSSLRITPYMMYGVENEGCPQTNLVIQVKEKDFGLIEVAPGFRTDLGTKLSTAISYNNLSGMNRSVALQLQGNIRQNLDGFDDRRKSEDKERLEYSVKSTFFEPYLFHHYIKTQIEFEGGVSFQKIRLSGFDADILKISPQFSKTFTKWLSTSVKYQFEKITQYDATTADNNDNFRIGGVTPSITMDFRDDAVNPNKGAFFNLSSEWANNRFGSMKQSDLEVNFVKVISRNKFYYPLGDFTLALSIAAGYQKNFANELNRDSNNNVILNDRGIPKTKGYIPGIKVFRLDGYDEIRGYDDGEINRTLAGQLINEIIIKDEVYFTALKFEPRYSITDNIKVGVFFDAGRLFVEHFKPLKLRTSAGLGLKYVTPVGSLDFDYGVKLQRKTSPEGNRDSVGRFHLSIGFF